MSVADNPQQFEQELKRVSQDYEKNGYAVIKNFLSPEEVQALRDESVRLIREDSVKETKKQLFGVDTYNMKSQYYLDSSDKLRFFYEEKAFDLETGELKVPMEQSVAKLAHAMHLHNPIFKQVSTSKKVQDVFRAINYGDPTICQSMVIFKNPQVGGEYTAHQDASFLCTEPVHLSGIWIALDDATLENGCLEFIPGSHKGPLTRRFVRTKQVTEDGKLLEWTAPPDEYDAKAFVPAEVKRGDMVVLHGLVVHQSAPNTSDKARWIYTFHVYDAKRAAFKTDNWCQPENKAAFMPIYAQ